MDQTLPQLTRNSSIQSRDIIDVNDEISQKAQRNRLLRNLFVVSLCYFLFYSGFWALSTLQSTMNGKDGMGDISQAIIYGVSMFSSLFLVDLMVGKFGCKRVLLVGTLLGCPYLAANMYLKWSIMMPASVLYGLMNGPFVAAQAIFIEEIATRFQRTFTENLETVMATFFGVFISFSESTQVCGNLLAYFLLKPKNVLPPMSNTTRHTECGIHFHPDENDTNTNLEPPPESQRLILGGSYVALGILSALLIAFFLDPLKNDLKEGGGYRLITNRVFAAVKFLRNPHQLLLLPISLFIGMEGVFYSNEITQAYIACAWGIHHVGFVTVCFGACGALISFLMGPLVKYTSQMAVLILAACFDIAICVLLYLWHPTPDQKSIFFIISGIWGMGDAIWWSQVTALYGLMFPKDREAAFSNLFFWSFVGCFVSYSYANYLSFTAKMNILLAVLITGMLGYLIGQFKIKCTGRKAYVHIEEEQQ